MDIYFLGHSAFRLQGKNASVVTDPTDPKVTGFKFPKTSADIVTVSHTQHSDHKSVELVDNVKRVISGPGEYEVMGVSVIGVATFHDDQRGKLRGKNTVYVIEIDDLRVAHLGDLGHTLSEKTLSEIGDIDILLIPVGGEFTIDSTAAVKVMQSMEPKITIPMHFQTPGLNAATFAKLATEEAFLSASGLPVENEQKLSVKRSTIGEDQKIVVLTRR